MHAHGRLCRCAADDALASAATRFRSEPDVDQVVICSPDKDLAQVVSDTQVICWDRRRGILYDEAAVLSRYAHLESIPDDPARWGLGLARARRARF